MLKQEKLLRLYAYVKENLYLCHSDLSIGKHKFNSNLLFGLLTGLNKGKQLVMGEYGGGKTTSAEYLLSMLYGIPRKVLVSSTLYGNPEITYEKVAGRPNLGELNNGIEKVIWSFFVTLEPKIIDEFNRIPENKQNLLLQGMDRGNWQYLNDMITNGDFSMFATVNYKDSGNTRLVEAAVDRFDIAVESRHPGINNLRVIRNLFSSKSSGGAILDDPATESKMNKVLLKDAPYNEKKKELLPLQEEFKRIIESRTGLKLLKADELSEVIDEMNCVNISKDANLFLDLVASELYSCMSFGQKRSNEDCVPNCHYKNLMCGKKVNCDSVRNTFAEIKYARSLAWLFGDSEADTTHFVSSLPYVLWHKTRFTENFLNDFKSDKRDDPLVLYVMKKSVNDMLNRFTKLRSSQYQMLDLMKSHKHKEAKDLAQSIDHPFFYDCLNID